jgi:chromosome segregation ATPase
MSQPAEHESRVSRLETEMAEVRHLARGASWEVGELRAELRSHTKVLNALRQTQVEQGQEMRAGFAETRSEFGRVDGELSGLRAEMRDGFAKLAVGQAQITALLTNQLGESGEDATD